MSKFNRSSFMKNRHALAQKQRQFYKDNFKELETPRYSDFLKTESPVFNNITVYEVSYQMTYTSAENGLSLKSPETFKVYALKGHDSEKDLINQTAEAVSNMQNDDKEEFNPLSKNLIESELKSKNNIKIHTPRGMEKTEEFKINSKILEGLSYNKGFYTEVLDQNVEVKNKGKNSYKYKVDLNTYIR